MNHNLYYQKLRDDYVAANRLPGDHESWSVIENILYYDQKYGGNHLSPEMVKGMREFIARKRAQEEKNTQ